MSSRAGQHERTQEQKSRDRALISSLYCRGWSYESIGQELAKYYPIGKDASTGEDQPGRPFSKAHIFKELRIIRKEWLRTQLAGYELRQVTELAKIDAIEAESWEGWRRSVGEQTETTEFIVPANGTVDVETGQPARTIERQKPSAGAPRFLDIVLQCVEKRCKILGLGTNEDPTALGVDEYGIRNVYSIPASITKSEWLKKYAPGLTVLVKHNTLQRQPIEGESHAR